MRIAKDEILTCDRLDLRRVNRDLVVIAATHGSTETVFSAEKTRLLPAALAPRAG